MAAARRQLEIAPKEWLRWWRSSGEGELRCILMTAWDPVGVSDEPAAWDEYDGYLLGVANVVRTADDADAASERVAAQLDHIERDFMGGATGERRHVNRAVADAIVAWHEWSTRRAGLGGTG